LAVRVIHAESLVAERADDTAADDARQERGRCDDREEQADAGTLADAPPAELVP
jgi:hypothetical protein